MKNSTKYGYSKTKIGWIPKEWKEIELGKIGTFSKGKGIPKRDLSVTGVPCIRYGEIYMTSNFVLQNLTSRISKSKIAETTQIQNNDLLFAGSGETIDEIGKSIAYTGQEDAYAGGDIVIFSSNMDIILAEFLSYYLNTKGRRDLRSLGQGQSVVHIYAKHLATVRIPLPPLPEQKAIASVLECWDKAIQKYEEKINKKKNIKKGLMQKLLSGEQRLPGFDGEWHSYRIEEIAQVNQSSLDTKTPKDYEFYYLDISSVRKGIVDFPHKKITYSQSPSRARRIIHFSDILMSTVRPNLLGHCYIDINVRDTVCSTGFAVITCHPNKANPVLIYNHLYSKSLNNVIQNLIAGSSYPAISSRDVKKLKVYLPPLPEQKAIASILSSADSEIKTLEKKLTLLRDQKKYLLNNLVTGTIRLPEFCKEVG